VLVVDHHFLNIIFLFSQNPSQLRQYCHCHIVTGTNRTALIRAID
jgi:hypothetical protein